MNLTLAKAVDRYAGNALAAGFGAIDGLAALLRPPPPPLHDVDGLLVVKFWGIGNWALLRPAVRDLRDRWPRARTTVLTLAANEPLVRDLADEVLLVRARGFSRTATDLARAVRCLRRTRPTLALDFEQFSRAGALVARAARVPQRIGFASGSCARDALFTARVPFRGDVHAARSFRDLVEAAGVPAAEYVPGHLAPTAAGLEEAGAALAGAGLPATSRPVVLHPGSGDNFPGRRWSEAGFVAAGRRVREGHAVEVVVTGGPSEAELCGRVAAACGPGAASLAGRLSLDGLVALLSRSVALLSNDTGPVHLASALGRPVLAFFGPNTPTLYGPLSAGSRAFYRGLPCSPCLTATNYRSSRCRLHTCMAALSVGEVLAFLDRTMAADRVGTATRAAGARRDAEGPWAAASR